MKLKQTLVILGLIVCAIGLAYAATSHIDSDMVFGGAVTVTGEATLNGAADLNGDVRFDDVGADAQIGSATISSGSKLITSSKIDTGSYIFLTPTGSLSDEASPYVSSATVGSATIAWASTATTLTFNWMVVND